MVKQSNLEIKVGAFVLLALTLLTVFIFSITDVAVFERGKRFSIVFGFTAGLKTSAPVRIAGVDEGLVEDVKVFFDDKTSTTKVRVEVKVGKDTKIPKDSRVMINQLGLLGEKYVEIFPGQDRNSFIKEGDEVFGEDPVAQEEITGKIAALTTKLETTIDNVNATLDEKNRMSLASTLENLSELSSNMNDVVGQIKTGQGTLGRFLYDDSLYDDLDGMVSDLKENPWKLLYKPKDK